MIIIESVIGIFLGTALGVLCNFFILNNKVNEIEKKLEDAEKRNLIQWHTICDNYHRKIEENYLLKKKIQEVEGVENKE